MLAKTGMRQCSNFELHVVNVLPIVDICQLQPLRMMQEEFWLLHRNLCRRKLFHAMSNHPLLMYDKLRP